MKKVEIKKFAIQNKLTGQLVTASTNSSPMFYRTEGLAKAAMAARDWSLKKAQEHEVVAATITVGSK